MLLCQHYKIGKFLFHNTYVLPVAGDLSDRKPRAKRSR